jgi:hypothetical protein
MHPHDAHAIRACYCRIQNGKDKPFFLPLFFLSQVEVEQGARSKEQRAAGKPLFPVYKREISGELVSWDGS